MSDTERARMLLRAKGYTCVLCKGEETVCSDLSGIAPMMGFLDAGTDLRGFSAADKIVGRAAAFLFFLAGVADVYAEVMTRDAAAYLTSHGIGASAGCFVDAIVNRRGDGICPMEDAVKNLTDPTDAREAIRARMNELRLANGKNTNSQ